MQGLCVAGSPAAALLAPAFLALASACSPPPRPPCDPSPPPGELGTVCGFDRPEDLLVFADAGLLVTSGMGPGVGLQAVTLDDLASPSPRPWRIWPGGGGGEAAASSAGEAAGDPACPGPPDPAHFYSHGLGDRPASGPGPRRLAAVNHGGREAVELFDLAGTGRSARLHWRGCVELPPGLFGNDVDIAPDGTLVLTNMMPTAPGPLFDLLLLVSSLGFETGEVLTWRRERGWQSVAGSGGAAPNGLVLSPDGRTVYFADNGRKRVSRLPLAGLPEGETPDVAVLGGGVDNVTWTRDDTILAIVHTGGPESVFQDCLLEWALFEIDPETLESRRLLQHGGDVLCGATSAQRVGDRIVIGSMNEARLGVWRAD